MAEELAAFKPNNTWSIQSVPPGKKHIGFRWVYKAKIKPDRSLNKYKPHLVAKGYTQQASIDILETFFFSVANITSIRILLAIAAKKCWHLIQLDVNNVTSMKRFT